MRLRRLDLTRYGKFTDRSIDFGPRPVGRPDFHIVFGPNEAGKSTLATAWLDLLFGIPDRSAMGFLHANLRVGARLEIGGSEAEFARIKARQGSLLGPGDLALPETSVLAHLPMKDRESHAAMFWLDDDTIEKGGESILASRGELGEMLFSSTAGLTGLSASLADMRETSDRFYRRQARNTHLADFKLRLDEIEAERRGIDIQASDFARLSQVEAAAQEGWARADADARAARTTLGAAERRMAAAPARRRLALCLTRLETLRDVPHTPANWWAELTELETDLGKWHGQLGLLTAQKEAFLQDAAALAPDPAALAERPGFAAAEALHPAHVEATKDLPARREAYARLQREIGQVLARLGRADGDVAEIRLDPDRLTRLQKLAGRGATLRVQRDAALREADASQQELVSAEATLARIGGSTAAPGLVALVQHIRAQAPGNALAQAQREADRAQLLLGQRMAALAPWLGDLPALRRLPPPASADLDAWSRDQDAARATLHQARADQARLRSEITGAEATLGAQSGTATLASDALIAARSLRERLWADHRLALTAETAKAFEAALRADDDLQAQRALVAAADAQEAALRLSLSRLTAAMQLSETTAAEAEEQAEAQSRRLASVAGFDVGSVAALRDWLARRAAALDAAAELDRAHVELDQAKRAIGAAQAALAVALDADAAQPFDLLLAKAAERADLSTRAQAAATARDQARDAADRRASELAAANAALAAWQQEVAAQLKGTWLAAEPDDQLEPALALLAELGPLADRSADLGHRIDTMQRNQAAFLAAVAELARALKTPGCTWEEVTERRRRAELAAARGEQIAQALTSTEAEIARFGRAISAAEARLSEMAGAIAAPDLAALRHGLEQGEQRRQLEQDRQVHETDLLAALGTSDLAFALSDLGDADADRLTAELAALQSDEARKSAEAQQAFAALRKAEADRAAVGSDAAVARLEARRTTVLLELAEATHGHLRRKLGLIAVDHALRAYRESHRGPMMQAASEAFAALTGGAYLRLATQPDRDHETLIAIAQDGGSKLAASLSKGTRFQLYLALRIAAYGQMAKGGDPLCPFFADDILETFDDQRSAAALVQFAQMACRGQVIYLTHHHHIVELARQHCPDVILHRLPG